MNSSTGRIRHPQRTSLPVPQAEGIIPTTVEHSRTNRPAGPVRARVNAVRTISTVLLSDL